MEPGNLILRKEEWLKTLEKGKKMLKYSSKKLLMSLCRLERIENLPKSRLETVVAGLISTMWRFMERKKPTKSPE